MPSRRAFVESLGATCGNWTWSWSFVNHDERFVLFGAWDAYNDGAKVLILEESWAVSPKGHRQPGYTQSREHVRLVEEGGYSLKTFPMQYGSADIDDPDAPAKILGFTPVIEDRELLRVGDAWFASSEVESLQLPQELDPHEVLREGAAIGLNVNAYERNAKAREACLAYYGRSCAVCEMEFETVYGPIAKSGIQVHHIVPISAIGKEYTIDPVKDLVPVCPNCHSVIHSTKPALTVSQLKAYLAERQA